MNSAKDGDHHGALYRSFASGHFKLPLLNEVHCNGVFIRLTPFPIPCPCHTRRVAQRIELIKNHLTALRAENAWTAEISPISPRNRLLERSVSHKTLETREETGQRDSEAGPAKAVRQAGRQEGRKEGRRTEMR